MQLILLLFLICIIIHRGSPSPLSLNVKDYLIRYGYIDGERQTDQREHQLTAEGVEADKEEEEKIASGLALYQERYGLPVDGLLNNETIKLMNTPRCDIPDSEFSVGHAWNKTSLQWSFVHLDVQSKLQMRKLISNAFNVWERATNLTFTFKYWNPKYNTFPDILISFEDRNHYQARTNTTSLILTCYPGSHLFTYTSGIRPS